MFQLPGLLSSSRIASLPASLALRRLMSRAGAIPGVRGIYGLAKAVAVVTVVVYLISPEYINSFDPDSRRQLLSAIVVIAVLSLVFSLFRFFKIVAVSCFWLLALILMVRGLEAPRVPALTANNIGTASPSHLLEGTRYTDLFSENESTHRSISDLEGKATNSNAWWRKLNPLTWFEAVLGRLSLWFRRGVHKPAAAATAEVSKRVDEFVGSTEKLTSEVSKTAQELAGAVGLEGIAPGHPDLANARLPDSAYFPRPHGNQPGSAVVSKVEELAKSASKQLEK